MKRFFDFIKSILEDIYDFFDMADAEEILVGTILFCLIGLIIFLIFFVFTREDYNQVKYNYILQKDVIVNDYVCIDNDGKGCYLKTSKGNIETNIDLKKDTKFDIGMKFGTCYNVLYFKVYRDDLVVPYEIKELYTFKKDSEEYKYYNSLYKMPVFVCKQ